MVSIRKNCVKILKKIKKISLNNRMRTRDSKGRFVKVSSSVNPKKQSKGEKFQDSKGRWHKSNGKYV